MSNLQTSDWLEDLVSGLSKDQLAKTFGITESPMKVFGYVRLGLGQNREEQEGLIRAYCAQAGLPAPVEIVIDSPAMAGRRLFDRWRARDMTGSCHWGDAIVLNRLFESFKDLGDLVHTCGIWLQRKLMIYAADFDFQANGKRVCFAAPDRTALLELLRATHKGLTNLRSELTKIGTAKARAKGKTWRSWPPYGFKRMRRRGKIVPDEAEQRLIEQMVAWHKAGLCFKDIWRRLLREGVRRRVAGRKREWSADRVRRVIRHALGQLEATPERPTRSGVAGVA